MKLKNEEFIHQLISLLKENGRVKVTNLGIFEIRKMASRKCYNVYDGKDIVIPAHNKIGFRALKSFKDAING